MRLRYNYRMYPDADQRAALANAFGCARVVFNDALRARQDAREQGLPYICDGDLSKRVITQAKATPERAWLGEVSAVLLQQTLADLNAAYRNFFSSLSGKRKGRKVAPPRFRSRHDTRQAIRFTKNARFAVTESGHLRLPKIGDVPVRWSRSLPSEPSSVTVIKDSAGRYFASFAVETSDEPLPETDCEVGIDLGLTHFAVVSDGEKVDNPRILRRAAKKLRRAQKALSRKEKGTCSGAARRSSNPPGVARAADRNLRPSGRSGSQSALLNCATAMPSRAAPTSATRPSSTPTGTCQPNHSTPGLSTAFTCGGMSRWAKTACRMGSTA